MPPTSSLHRKILGYMTTTAPTLTLEQTAEMRQKMRAENGAGRPERAAAIKVSLENGVYNLGSGAVEIHAPIQPSLNAKTEAWQKYALEVSNIDPEVIKGVKRKDLIGMLRANGIVAPVEILDDDDDNGDDTDNGTDDETPDAE